MTATADKAPDAASPPPPVERTPDQIEKAAKAMAAEIGDDWDAPYMFRLGYTDTHEDCRETYRDMVRAALSALGARDE